MAHTVKRPRMTLKLWEHRSPLSPLPSPLSPGKCGVRGGKTASLCRARQVTGRYGDGRGLAAPKAYVVQFWDGEEWTDAEVRTRRPDDPTASALNRLRIVPVETERIRVVFEHDSPAFTGVSELMIWEGSW